MLRSQISRIASFALLMTLSSVGCGGPSSTMTQPDDGTAAALAQEVTSIDGVTAGAPAAILEAAAPGDVISFYRHLWLPLVKGNGWLVLYRSTDALGRPIAVSGTIIVPKAAWTGSGPRPIIAFAHETVGITDECAPSRTIALGLYLEKPFVSQALARGWAVALTDYEGLGTPGKHTYCVNVSEAHAVLDSVRAAIRLPGTGLDANAPVAIWGYSQGGGAAGAAAEAAASYAPELAMKGVAAGGAVADLEAVSKASEGSLFMALHPPDRPGSTPPTRTSISGPISMTPGGRNSTPWTRSAPAFLS